MGKNVYRTAAGAHVDMDTMRLVNESVVAVGNMAVNARGDQVAPDGSIIKTRNEVMKEHYRAIQPVVKYNPNKKRGPAEAEAPIPDLDSVAEQESEPAPVTLRTRLADSVAIDLVETPPVLNTKNLTRI